MHNTVTSGHKSPFFFFQTLRKKLFEINLHFFVIYHTIISTWLTQEKRKPPRWRTLRYINISYTLCLFYTQYYFNIQKKRLKVGKKKLVPDNFTDTAFKSKSTTITKKKDVIELKLLNHFQQVLLFLIKVLMKTNRTRSQLVEI